LLTAIKLIAKSAPNKIHGHKSYNLDHSCLEYDNCNQCEELIHIDTTTYQQYQTLIKDNTI
jgi:hypothetical protein